jgi:hypothetical protein
LKYIFNVLHLFIFILYCNHRHLGPGFYFFNFINKMCIYNVYEPVWHASLWNKRLYELCPIFLIYLLYTRQECQVCSKNSNKCTYRYPRCYPLEKNRFWWLVAYSRFPFNLQFVHNNNVSNYENDWMLTKFI